MFVGVTIYTAHDINFTVLGYVWIAIWYTFAVFEMVYVKKVVDTVQMTTWSRTYYQVKPQSQALLWIVPLVSTDLMHHACALRRKPTTAKLVWLHGPHAWAP